MTAAFPQLLQHVLLELPPILGEDEDVAADNTGPVRDVCIDALEPGGEHDGWQRACHAMTRYTLPAGVYSRVIVAERVRYLYYAAIRGEIDVHRASLLAVALIDEVVWRSRSEDEWVNEPFQYRGHDS